MYNCCSQVKHLCKKAEEKQANLTDGDVMRSIYRNFGGICPDASNEVFIFWCSAWTGEADQKVSITNTHARTLHTFPIEKI